MPVCAPAPRRTPPRPTGASRLPPPPRHPARAGEAAGALAGRGARAAEAEAGSARGKAAGSGGQGALARGREARRGQAAAASTPPPPAPPGGVGEPPKRRLWLRFLTASVVIVVAAATATAVATLVFGYDFAARLGGIRGVQHLLAGPTAGPQTILLLGADKRPNEGDKGRSDTTILLRVTSSGIACCRSRAI